VAGPSLLSTQGSLAAFPTAALGWLGGLPEFRDLNVKVLVWIPRKSCEATTEMPGAGGEKSVCSKLWPSHLHATYVLFVSMSK